MSGLVCTPRYFAKRSVLAPKDAHCLKDFNFHSKPDIPKDQYTRRRPYTTMHKNIWATTLEKFKYVKCIYQNCYFIAMSLEDMIYHFGYCIGDGSFAKFVCPHCNGRMTSEIVLAKHIELSHSMENCSLAKEAVKEQDELSVILNQGENSGEKHVQNLTQELDKNKVGELLNKNQISGPVSDTKMHADVSKPVTSNITNLRESVEKGATNSVGAQSSRVPKKRGRPKKHVEEDLCNVKCGKCDFRGLKSSFNDHNMRKHVGLGWIEGEQVVDMSDEKQVLRLVTAAFKLTKKGVCEKCGDLKRSVLGFVSHIENCGKSPEEKNALKVECKFCGKKYMKSSLLGHKKLCQFQCQKGEGEKVECKFCGKEYMKSSLSGHMKLCQFQCQKEEEEKEFSDGMDGDKYSPGKRKSALMAVTKFQQVLRENEESETKHYFLYEKFESKIPKLNSKLNNLWYRLKKEGKKIPCQFAGCEHVSDEVLKAKTHHFTCPFLPDKAYLCELCDFTSVEESAIQDHMFQHQCHRKPKKSIDEEIKIEEIKEEDDGDGEEKSDEEECRKRKRESNENHAQKRTKLIPGMLKPDIAFEARLKQIFCKREKIEHVRGYQFYYNGLEMTLETEKSEGITEKWPELHTVPEDWSQVPSLEALLCCPKLNESVAVRDTKWRTFRRFEGSLVGGVPIMFTGGSVRSLSWCKVSVRRMVKKVERQYLAVSTAWGFDHLKNIHDRSTISRSNIIQIWDCGELQNDSATETPKFSLGIVTDGGEVWDVVWFPEDTFSQGTGERLSRIGLLASASEDGCVRIWSICDPNELVNNDSLPMYLTEPVATLKRDEGVEESCYRLSVSPDGMIAGGFTNGLVAVWNLNNISSPFCKKSGKGRIVRAHLVVQAHKTAVTALSFCTLNSRYLSTGGLDRYVKMWDLEVPAMPVDQYNKEYSLDNIWSKNWPLVIYNFDDVVLNCNKGTVKFIKDIFTDRHQSSFVVHDTCLSLSFSDWLNCLCGGTTTGEVKLRLMKNFLSDQKRSQSQIISCLQLEKLGEKISTIESGTDVQLNYENIRSEYGLFFQDDLGVDKMKPKKMEVSQEEISIRAVNKVLLNPNFKSFTHVATGYNNGFVRIQPLKELQSSKSLQSFLEKVEKEVARK